MLIRTDNGDDDDDEDEDEAGKKEDVEKVERTFYKDNDQVE